MFLLAQTQGVARQIVAIRYAIKTVRRTAKAAPSNESSHLNGPKRITLRKKSANFESNHWPIEAPIQIANKIDPNFKKKFRNIPIKAI